MARLYGEGYSVVPRPVFAHNLLFLSSGFDSPVVYAIKPEGAKGDATKTNIAWTQRKAAPNTPSLIVVGPDVYYISDMGIATCADAVSGKVYLDASPGRRILRIAGLCRRSN